MPDETVTITGRRVKGLGVGGRYISHPYYSQRFREILGCTPYPGTLNIETGTDWRQLAAKCEPILIPETEWEGRRLGAVYVWQSRLETLDGEEVPAALIRPLLSRHPPNVLEIVACEKLAPRLGDKVTVKIQCRPNPDYTNPPRLPQG